MTFLPTKGEKMALDICQLRITERLKKEFAILDKTTRKKTKETQLCSPPPIVFLDSNGVPIFIYRFIYDPDFFKDTVAKQHVSSLARASSRGKREICI